MPTSADRLYKQLSSVRALTALVGKSEDADFDCKEWPVRPEDARRVIAKAACGFANATGGVKGSPGPSSQWSSQIGTPSASSSKASRNTNGLSAEACEMKTVFIRPPNRTVTPHEEGINIGLVEWYTKLKPGC